VLGEQRSLVEKAARLLATGVALVIAGYVWDLAFPINKSLWTSSYAVFTAGQAMCVLGLCFWLIDVKGHERWTTPFVVYGVNALTVFVLSGILAKTLLRIQVADPSGAGTTSLQRWIFESAFLPLAAPIDASLLYAIAWIGMWFLILWGMYRRDIIVKV
jgi:predicted acyltransferase